ncbi:MAG: MBL fold metallo-hydrolase [Dehalococcoidia bacterium]|jgi:glyoxylase-like metal-dependent hydrolase (beta-lactamase superfamily II)
MAENKQVVIPITTPMVNSYIVRGDKPIIVDTGLPGYDASILQSMEENGIGPGDVSLIIITHCHQDHFGSVAALKQKTGAPVAIHKADAEYLKTGGNPPLIPVGAKGKTMEVVSKMVKKPEVTGLTPDILIESEMDLAKYGVKGKIILTPGHTPGGISIALESGEVLVGDLIFGGLIRPAAPGFPYFAESVEQLLQSIQKVLDLQPKIIYAGHGGPFTAESVRRRFFK